MSFSANFPDWSQFKERAVTNTDVNFVSMAAQMAALINERGNAVREGQRAVEDERKRWLEALAKQATLVVQLTIVLDRYEATIAQHTQEPRTQLQRSYRSLRIVKDQMLDALRSAGLEVVIPLRKSFDELGETVRVENWIHHERFTAEVVAEVKEPVVYFEGTLVQQGRVVMGAPIEEELEAIIVGDIEQTSEERNV